jgi:hypothetical protein
MPVSIEIYYHAFEATNPEERGGDKNPPATSSYL